MSNILTITSVKCIKPSSAPAPDDLYIKVNGVPVWPSKRKYPYPTINEQQSKDIGYSTSLASAVKIELWDYDLVGSDDLLGRLEVDSAHQLGDFTYPVQNPTEGSFYEINIRVSYTS